MTQYGLILNSELTKFWPTEKFRTFSGFLVNKTQPTCLNYLIFVLFCQFNFSICVPGIDECLSRPCFNGGTCVDTDTGFNCLCPQGVTGQYCQVDIDECTSNVNPCMNGATCINRVGSYFCQCPFAWSGKNCNIGENLQTNRLNILNVHVYILWEKRIKLANMNVWAYFRERKKLFDTKKYSEEWLQ